MTTVLCVPQWQGSASDRARRLVAGAHRAAALVPADTMVTVPVLEDGGEKVAGVRALDVLVENQRRIRDALAGIDDQVITVGGECSVDIAATGLRRHGVADLERAFDDLDGPVYVHVDLDVLEPTVFESTCYRYPGGVHPRHLVDLIAQVDDIVGAAITEHAPSSDEVNKTEAEVIRQIGTALAR